MIPGAVHRSPSICFTADENSGNPQLGDRPMQAVRPVFASNEIPFLQMRSQDRIAGQEGRRMERSKGRGGLLLTPTCLVAHLVYMRPLRNLLAST